MGRDVPPPPWSRNPWDGNPDCDDDLGAEVEQLKEMVAKEPANLDLQEWLAFKFYSGKRYHDAEMLLRHLIVRGHRPGTQAFYLGNVLHKLGRTSEAIEFWTMTVNLMPGDPKSTKAAARIEQFGLPTGVRPSGKGSR